MVQSRVPGCKDCEASTSGVCARHGTEEYFRVSYKNEVEEAKDRLFLAGDSPHVCPICQGRGFVGAGFYSSVSGIATTGGTAFEPCRTCQGEGIVWPR